MSNPKSPVTDLLRKLKADTDTAIKSLQAFNETLGDVVPRVAEVEGLEMRAATARVQLASDTSQLRETQAALIEAKGEYSALQAQLSEPATKLHELRTMLKSL
jgi:chromosome segregation ATPase